MQKLCYLAFIVLENPLFPLYNIFSNSKRAFCPTPLKEETP
ncbi:hypothetical protein SUBVAR_05243 [Subdoligranulum variabile DSM 15176]|uniref:Uncharacterized protein n=1 Tax=Subdoligranulum variabile DSM 15176 TaxID=411471 RepID=D1PLM6_9FIRM|nr:hypothetical protein SUBVAR_05243 [Subdoligranulum variabile DSM 15176]